jgi:hypothetical protein
MKEKCREDLIWNHSYGGKAGVFSVGNGASFPERLSVELAAFQVALGNDSTEAQRKDRRSQRKAVEGALIGFPPWSPAVSL